MPTHTWMWRLTFWKISKAVFSIHGAVLHKVFRAVLFKSESSYVTLLFYVSIKY